MGKGLDLLTTHSSDAVLSCNFSYDYARTSRTNAHQYLPHVCLTKEMVWILPVRPNSPKSLKDHLESFQKSNSKAGRLSNFHMKLTPQRQATVFKIDAASGA